MKILVTGGAGFIGGYVVAELLQAGHHVVALDNYSKYGPVEKSYQAHPRYTFVQGDAKDPRLLCRLVEGATSCWRARPGSAASATFTSSPMTSWRRMSASRR